MGFGAMLTFQITDTPLRLGYWLLSNLDLQSMLLKLPNGLAIEVDEEAVEVVLGLPRGTKVITDRAKHEKSVILNSWRESFEKVDYSITPTDVAQKLQKYPDGGECFIRNYAILVVSTVVRCMQNGYVYQHVLPNLDDTLEIANLNWCRYVIHSLISTLTAWKAGETQRFTGPLVFLTVLYVDRVRVGVCTVPRTLPSFVGWDSELLKQREETEITTGRFGRGPIVELMRPEKKDIRIRVTDKARTVAEMTTDKSDDNTKLWGTARSLLGINPTLGVHAHVPQPSDWTDGAQHDDDFYSNPDFLKAVEEIERAVHDRNALSNGASVTLGVDHGAGSSHVRHNTHNVTLVERASVIRTRSAAKDFSAHPSALPTSGATHSRTHPPVHDDCVTTAPQVLSSVIEVPTSATMHLTGSAPLRAPETPQEVNHPPTPVLTKRTHHVDPVEEMQHAVHDPDAFFDVPSFSLGLTQDAGNSLVRQTTPFGTSQQRPSVITTRSAAKHNACKPFAQTSPGDPPSLTHLSVPDDGVTTTPQVFKTVWMDSLGTPSVFKLLLTLVLQVVVMVPRPPTSTTSYHTGHAPLKPLKPLREGKHPLTPVVTKLSHRVAQVGGRPTWIVPGQTYVYRWVVDNNNSRDEELFRYNDYKASWGGIATLQEGSKVSYKVVDAWACVLNYQELTKGVGVPNRFFASTKIALQSAVNHTALRSLRLGWFTKNLEADFNNSAHETWREIQIYIFPILKLGHFYMISVDTVAKKVDIIDSSSAAKKKGEMYGQTPAQLVDLLSTFLDDKLLIEIGAQIRDIKPKRMQMSWRVAKNEVDSAMYTMRHMESYCGQGVANWNVGLQRGNYRQLRVLREYFMRELLMSDINIHQNSNIKRALNFANGLARNTQISFNLTVLCVAKTVMLV
ncbi:uncharacterized protein LOC116001763 [Ipomoea triloba]|uniref:uncharacterized protein LOC116001763 n=1 Tax=Ipomoea triloba TaxID=35885 RepID=UPI00125DB843|nr:uncharacterized protein LOC116001763 [Ipomoea triloba]